MDLSGLENFEIKNILDNTSKNTSNFESVIYSKKSVIKKKDYYSSKINSSSLNESILNLIQKENWSSATDLKYSFLKKIRSENKNYLYSEKNFKDKKNLKKQKKLFSHDNQFKNPKNHFLQNNNSLKIENFKIFEKVKKQKIRKIQKFDRFSFRGTFKKSNNIINKFSEEEFDLISNENNKNEDSIISYENNNVEKNSIYKKLKNSLFSYENSNLSKRNNLENLKKKINNNLFKENLISKSLKKNINSPNNNNRENSEIPRSNSKNRKKRNSNSNSLKRILNSIDYDKENFIKKNQNSNSIKKKHKRKTSNYSITSNNCVVPKKMVSYNILKEDLEKLSVNFSQSELVDNDMHKLVEKNNKNKQEIKNIIERNNANFVDISHYRKDEKNITNKNERINFINNENYFDTSEIFKKEVNFKMKNETIDYMNEKNNQNYFNISKNLKNLENKKIKKNFNSDKNIICNNKNKIFNKDITSINNYNNLNDCEIMKNENISIKNNILNHIKETPQTSKRNICKIDNKNFDYNENNLNQIQNLENKKNHNILLDSEKEKKSFLYSNLIINNKKNKKNIFVEIPKNKNCQKKCFFDIQNININNEILSNDKNNEEKQNVKIFYKHPITGQFYKDKQILMKNLKNSNLDINSFENNNLNKLFISFEKNNISFHCKSNIKFFNYKNKIKSFFENNFFLQNYDLVDKFNFKENLKKKFKIGNFDFFENWSNSLINEFYEININYKNHFFSNTKKRLKNLLEKFPSLKNKLDLNLKNMDNLEIIKEKLFEKISKSENYLNKVILKRIHLLIDNLICIDNIFLINSQKKCTLNKILFFYQKYNFENFKKINFFEEKQKLDIEKFKNDKYARIVFFNKIDSFRFEQNFNFKNILMNCQKKYFIKKFENCKIEKEKWCEFLSFLKINKNIY